ncbi:hypothetical protein CTI14_01815 [Methylobacterium radiotolerans]|nr:hypothetical protein CTI14_01815 [Methylobacterium radiotolerans]
MHIDIIEVKSYDATAPEGTTAEPLQQLRAVEQVIYAMQTRQGEILVDRRRELLRLQMYREGLLHQEIVSPDWVEMLNATIDGGAEPQVNLYWVEVLFDENIPTATQDQTFKSADDQRLLNAKHIRLGEGEIQGHLEMIPKTRMMSSALEPQLAFPLVQADRVKDMESESMPLTVFPETEQGASSITEATSADISRHVDANERQEIESMARNIFRVLQDVGVKLAGEVNADDADVGPSIVRYKLRLKPDQELSRFQRRSRDIMRELEATREPIIDNLPGTNFVYIDLPRTHPRPVSLLSVINDTHDQTRVNSIDVPFGITPEGTVVRLDLTELPHMLIGGSTGSGKTMFLYSLIAYVAKNYSPEQLQLILVDPKETDFVFFDNLPHLHGSHVITDAAEAVERLQGLLDDELNERTERLRSVAARDIRSYNSRPEVQPMRRIIVVIDEFADLMDVMPTKAQKEAFEGSLRRLAQRARNVGIHLILATQRPTTDIVNGTIKTNLPCRVGFRLAAAIDSQSILGQGGAEKLLGNGDMFVVRGGETTRLQGFYISETELVELINGIRA